MDENAIRAVVARLARPRRAGGQEIERAAILAAGVDAPEVVRWILAHHGEPEQGAEMTPRRGLHGAQITGSGAASRTPQRFVLPPGMLDEPSAPEVAHAE